MRWPGRLLLGAVVVLALVAGYLAATGTALLDAPLVLASCA